MFLSRFCGAVALAQGDRDLSSSSDLLFAFPLAFDRLLEFLLVISFLFLFSSVTKMCVLSMHSSRGD
jgi:hypothetical protein